MQGKYLLTLLVAASPCWAAATSHAAWYDNRSLRTHLDEAIDGFFGRMHGNWVVPRGKYRPLKSTRNLSRQFKEVFDGVPGQSYPTSSGHILYSGCQAHNCGVAAAVLTDPGDSRINAAALIHWKCAGKDLPRDRRAEPGTVARAGGCDAPGFPTLTLFFRDKSRIDAAMSRDLRQWARARLRTDRLFKHLAVVVTTLSPFSRNRHGGKATPR